MRVRELIDILRDQPPDAEIELAVIAHVDDDADDITVDRWSIEAVVPWDDEREAVANEDDDTDNVTVWLVGGEDLDQERQRVAEPGTHRGAEFPFRVLAQRVEQRTFPVVGLQPGRVARVGAEPQLGLGMGSGTWCSDELGDRGPRTPCIGPHRTSEQMHSFQPRTSRW